MSGNCPKRYWKSLEERDLTSPAAHGEFSEESSARPSRRDFLKLAGFTFTGALLTGCSRAPVEKAIPLLVQPEGFVPGRALFYASTCAGCSAGCGLLVKCRDGRPIKLEGNPAHPASHGGLCAVGQASILGLYDSQRLKQPRVDGKQASWGEVDRVITAQLEALRKDGGAVRFLTGSITSPALRDAIGKFLKFFPNARHAVYDPLSSSAILDAHERTHGVRVLPQYRFDRAEVIASFDADFLGTWISPVEFTRAYQAGRNLAARPARMSYHIQFESCMSLTGSKADRRYTLAPGEFGLLLTHLAQRVAKKAGANFETPSIEPVPIPAATLDALAERLWQARGRSLVVSGSQDTQVQILCNFLNHLLGSYGSTLDIEHPSFQREGNDRELASLLQELRDGKVSALLVHGVNPAYDLPGGSTLREALRRVPLTISFAERLDETASAVRFVCPDHHYLESWSDAEAVSGTVSLSQPVLHPQGSTRSVLETLAAWSGKPRSAYDILRENWQENIFPRQKAERSFETFWDKAVEAGYAEVESPPQKPRAFSPTAVSPMLKAQAAPAKGLALVLYPKVTMLDGRHAYNPWLQELPDPVSKVSWDNYACLSPATAARLGISEGDVVRIEAQGSDGNSRTLELPALLQPGQHNAIVAVALGYGSDLSRRFANVGPSWLDAQTSVGEDGRVGKNAALMLEMSEGALRYSRNSVQILKTGKKVALACTQSHHTLTVPEKLATSATREPRPIIQETTFQAFQKNPAAGTPTMEKPAEDLWPADHPYTGHRWAMAIDLSACTGCSACVVSCQSENNIPVVGKDEVRRKREMQWLRVDRYYSGDGDDLEVAYQPMLCQQCENAPCETVCPVLATVHSEEGLNEQVYNRCVGTRYCANNCPYKTRRFNWFEYARNDRLQNLSLNPDVTVRSRGVMEKCSFCVQRIQEAKIEAKRRGEIVADGVIQTACQQSCPAQAIVFGDLNDPKSRVAKLVASGRAYRVLEELDVRPAVHYLSLVRNREEG